ncbi:3D-(3,5/4)-trihydroxycyclohexane-1,2-dione acylhydrolase (decyclizing) [Rubellimicrobium rubrum]|uniref:3D-(3,5/4)-trihydroxycyclohexane-1,2-dione acylhydrolase (Decyclizing) n=1 Tax=Rubellimicrobium rubrum TaxID=2585369 RepID=A0A5C4MQ36_9RHOB|nr:3D-(3,5/4)-trihydroxycyclohexane-1,2-dione acylhydrolase (decyclizing) [Rubellimicrobium rubrum]TNC46704.1 3D-(3,5/4)-trihydroxycyclohexane-1,2-dione acylhydrolase (decyclizing) [Rubellimicrobium rubrum]
MVDTIRLTAAQAMMRWLSVQRTEDGDRFIEGVWAIFGHGNVAGIGEALHGIGDALPTWRGQNEQTMAHAAIAYAKQKRRRKAMAVTSSIGPGATNMVTACALAHVNRLPVLLIPGDVFANRRPDPVLQQIEDFEDGTISVNDCFKPVARYFDRIARPEHLLTALPRALQVMTDPQNAGPAVLAFCQDVQAELYDYPASFFEPRTWRTDRRAEPDPREVADVADMIARASRPVLISGGGVLYSGAENALAAFAERHNVPFVETQAGKGGLAASHPLNFGSPGVTGSDCANEICMAADLVIGVGTRFQDFTTGSWSLFRNAERRLVSINLHPYDAAKHLAMPLVADARVALERLSDALSDLRFDGHDPSAREAWLAEVGRVTAAPAPDSNALPTDAQVIGAVQRAAGEDTVVMCAAGTMPGALQVLWQAARGGYHMEYGYSCMGYEVAGAMGIKIAAPDKEVICFVGDGSYMMANSELATAVMRRIPFTVVLTDNRGYGCINRLQIECGGAEFNNMYKDSLVETQPEIDFVAHARSMGATAVKAADIAALGAEIADARGRDVPTVIVIDTDAVPGLGVGGTWWDVAVPQVGGPERLEEARRRYDATAALQRTFN